MLSLPGYTQDQQYPFSYLRLESGEQRSKGIAEAGDFTVTPASGLQVQISEGSAWATQTVARLGAFYAARSNYFLFSDGTASPFNTITAPVSHPRVDQIVARVYDSYEQQLTGNSFWRFEWLTGTETSGADLSNLDGIADLTPNSLQIACVLNTVGETSIDPDNILMTVPLSSVHTNKFTFNIPSGTFTGANQVVTKTVNHGFGIWDYSNVVVTGAFIDSNFAALIGWSWIAIDQDNITMHLSNSPAGSSGQTNLQGTFHGAIFT